MPITDFSTVPVVDIAALLSGALPAQQAVAEQLGRAARDVGFVYVTGCAPSADVVAGLMAATSAFFALPHDEKMRVYIGNSRNHRGYVPQGEEVFGAGGIDRKEAYDLSLDLPAEDPAENQVDDARPGRPANPMIGPNQWPDLAGFRDAIDAYYEHTFTVGRALFRGFALAMGEDAGFFDRYLTEPPSQLRLIHYPAADAADDRPGIGAHTDYECFTLLRSTAPGLEVRNGAGVWVDAPPVEGAYVVNIGDLFETWTNGAFVATTHRVRTVTEERYSFPLFCTVDYHTVVTPLPRFVTAGRPARGSLVAGEHLYAQTAQTFTYLKNRLAAGELTLPEGALALSSFGRPDRVATPLGS